MIFGDALYFQNGAYSSQSQQLAQLAMNRLYTYHNAWQALRFYAIDSNQTIGLFISILVIVAFIWFILRNRFTPSTFGVFVFLIPFVFYVMALYGGQAIIWVPGANPAGDPVYMYNVRYGVQMVAPAAFYVAILVNELHIIHLKHIRSVGRIIVVGVIILQSILIASQGIISLQEGQYDYACHPQPVNTEYLKEHYNGGRILEEVFTTQVDPTEIGINFKNFIYEGSGQIWPTGTTPSSKFGRLDISQSG